MSPCKAVNNINCSTYSILEYSKSITKLKCQFKTTNDAHNINNGAMPIMSLKTQ